MMRDDILTAVDVGTTKVCTLIGRKSGRGDLEFLAHSVVPCEGLKKGNVTDVAATALSIRSSVDEAAKQAQVAGRSAYIGVTGAHVAFENRWDQMEWAGQGGVITAEELARVPDSARAANSETGRRLIHVLPVAYSVDGLNGIRNPLGMHSSDLAVESHMITGGAAFIDKLVEAVDSAGIGLDALVLEPLASSDAVLTNEERIQGAIVVDIGGGTTDIVAYARGRIFFTGVLPVGGYQFTNDICVTYSTPYPDAEDLKLRYAHTDLHGVRATEEVTLPVIGKNADLKISRREICQLVRERAQELASLVKLKLQEAPLGRLSDFSLVLTGGTASLPGLDGLFRQTMGTNVRIGVPNGHGMIPDSLRAPAFATGVGILLWAFEHPKPQTAKVTITTSAKAPTDREGLVSRFFQHIRNVFPAQLFSVRQGRTLWR